MVDAGKATAPQPPVNPNVQASSGGGFARKSSGLVRDFSQWDQWMYNMLAMNVVVTGALLFGLITFLYPGASLPLAFIIAGAFCVAEAVFYGCLTAIMPRSGGDYIFQSRVFGGGIATVFAFTNTYLTQILYYALAGALLATLILAPFFEILGHVYDASWMISFGEWVVTKWGIFVCGLTAGLIACLVNAFGLHVYARVQRWTFYIGMGLLIFFIFVMLFTPHTDFVSNINNLFSEHYGTSNMYEKTIDAGGVADTSFSLKETLFAAVIAGFMLIWQSWGVQQAGETKRAGSVMQNVRTLVAAEVASVALMVLLAVLLDSRVGSDFMYASGTLFNSGAENNPLPVPPFLGFFFAVAGNSPIFFWLAFVMFICWFVNIISNAMLAGSRTSLAMSFDRVFPEFLGRVNRRWHSPINAIVTFALLIVPAAILYLVIDNAAQYTLSLYLVSIVCFGVSSFAAIALPYVRANLYKGSPAESYRIAGMPMISVAGAIFAVYAIGSAIVLLTQDALGVNTSKGLFFIFGLWAISLIVYLVALFARRAEKIDLSLAYKQLPIE